MAGPVLASSSGAARGWAYAPNSTMADFISNSAILATVRPSAVLVAAAGTSQGAKSGRVWYRLCHRSLANQTFPHDQRSTSHHLTRRRTTQRRARLFDMSKFAVKIWPKSRSVRFSSGIVAAVLILMVIAAAVWAWLRAGASETGSNGETLRTVGLLIGGFVALCFGIWRASVAERQSDAAQKQVGAVLLQADTAQKGLLNDRHQRGAQMLGSEVLAVRLGGVYALQQLAEEHPNEYHVLGGVVKRVCSRPSLPGAGRWPGKTPLSWHNGSPRRATA